MSDSELDPTPHDHDHPHDPTLLAADAGACQKAAAIFRALGDPNRLRLLSLLAQRELCVSELTVILGDNLPAVSQRLKLLRSDRIVIARREGKHVFYRLADQHICELMNNGLEHAREEGH
ncbi:MAG: ArsR/SmtB family transcription factor [Planctomycetaceae bacterium]